MPAFGPIKRSALVQYLKQLGFDGPYSGGKHQFMVRDGLRLTIPNPHQGDISKALLTKILRQAQISREEWEKLI
ncbi:MAG: type II toxin-antitoxin system HicA family toxin [Spirulina sp.]